MTTLKVFKIITEKTSSYVFSRGCLAAILVCGWFLLHFLQDRVVGFDASSWFENALNLYENGKTGCQFRNILYAYILYIPLALKIDCTTFALSLSALSVLFITVLLYEINIRKSSVCPAAFTSLAFLLSFPMLRFGSQVFSDIPTLAAIMCTVFIVWLVMDKKQDRLIPLVYLFASLSISLRYASFFFFPALLIFFWSTRKKLLFHIAGLCLSVVPYIPQLVYNHHYLNGLMSISYVEHQPTLSFTYFFQELEFGKRFQLFHYLNDLFFNFKGIFILFSPFVFIGVKSSFTEFDRRFAKFLIVYFVSTVILLSFFVAFSNRYVIAALLPCYIWLNIGIKRAYTWVQNHKWNTIAVHVFLLLALYGNFEICFHAVQSTRAIHYARFSAIKKIDSLVKDGDVVACEIEISRYFSQFNNMSIKNRNITYITSKEYETFLNGKAGSSSAVYCIMPTVRWLSEGINRKNAVGQQYKTNQRPDFSLIAKISSENIVELSFYKILRFFYYDYLIPHEDWLLVKSIQVEVPKKT
ncbi:MAG: hypothetical protein JW915_00610 [Chitinispirillaceae bacterium]|nr:hypothetical protein [Chitinispirillaceae bacterium]